MVAGHASALDGEGTCSGQPRVCAVWIAALLAVLVAGCGSSSSSGAGSHARARAAAPKLNLPCAPVARAAVARELRVPVSSLRATPGTANSGSPQCVFRAPRATITGVIYSGPQPYFLLERTIIEYQQQFTTMRVLPSPVHIDRLGLDASWFPAPHWVMTTDGVRMITILVDWRGVSQARRRALGIALARTYLGPLNPKAADPNGS